MALENGLKIVYLCRTHTQNFRALRELKKITQFLSKNKFDKQVNGISIKGRHEMCLNKILLQLKLSPRDSISVCRDLRKNKNCKYFSKLIKDLGKTEDVSIIAKKLLIQPCDADEIISFAEEAGYCPYFLSKYLLEKVGIVICSYHWLFNPDIKDVFLKFLDTDLFNCILINDECHNLLSMATEVNSERITPFILKLALKDLELYNSDRNMINLIRILIAHLENKQTNLNVEECELNPEILIKNLYEKIGLKDLNSFKILIKDLKEFSSYVAEIKSSQGLAQRDSIGSIAKYWLKWLEVLDSERYFFCYNINTTREGKKNISMEIVALDPREITVPVFKNAFSTLSLSGTVNSYVYSNLMGLNETGKTSKVIVSPSPFPKNNIKALIIENVNTKRGNRNAQTYKKMVNKIEEVIYSTPGNIGIFCASYNVLKGLLEQDIEQKVQKYKKKLYIEDSKISAAENAKMIEDFKGEGKNNGGILLGVAGGRNSEGEDYPAEYMNSVVVAGFPYHVPSPRVNAKIKYYDKVFHNRGWEFAYLYPAIERANQAAGRPIRRLDDKGAIIFLDNRFKDKMKWISSWLRDEIEIVPDKKGAIIQQLYPFWNE